MGITGHCHRCREFSPIFRTGPLVGLCLSCIENDHIGMTARIAELEAECGILLPALKATLEGERSIAAAVANDPPRAARLYLEEFIARRERCAELEAQNAELRAALSALIDTSDAIGMDVEYLPGGRWERWIKAIKTATAVFGKAKP
jgi:hypothetical protein